MKILYIFEKMHNLGGMERILTTKMNYLVNHTSYEIYLYMYEQGNIPIPFSLSDKVHLLTGTTTGATIGKQENLNFTQWIITYYKYRRAFKKDLEHVLKLVSPAIVVCMTYSFDLLDIILKLSEKRSKVIMESHVAGQTIVLARKFKYNPYIWNVINLWDKYILSKVKSCHCLITLTNADAQYWRSYASHIKVIPNMVTVVPEKTADYGAKRVISAGRYTYQKGFDLLIKAWKMLVSKHPDWELYIYGNGDRSEYLKLVRDCQVENNVHLMPATDNIIEEYYKSSIYVMSSRYEGFGLVLTEAMSCGLPCVSFDCPYGPSEIIQNGIDGFLITQNDITALSNSLDTLMSDVGLRIQLGHFAKVNVERFAVDAIMTKWTDLFDEMASS